MTQRRRPNAMPFRNICMERYALAFGVAASFGCAARHPPPDPVLVQLSCCEIDSPILNALKTTIVDVTYSDRTFEEVLADIAKRAGVDSCPSWTALSAAGIERDEHISLTFHRTTLFAVLHAVVWTLVGGETELEFGAFDNCPVVSTREELSRHTCRCAYYVGDFVSRDIPMRRIGEFPTMRYSHSLSGESPDRGTELRTIRGPDTIIHLIIELIDPESWRVSGGNVGYVSIVGDYLIVEQSHVGHRAIAELIADLRTLLKSDPDAGHQWARRLERDRRARRPAASRPPSPAMGPAATHTRQLIGPVDR